MLNIFKRGHNTLHSDIEAWAVRWNKQHGQFSGDWKETVQFFTNKEEAQEFEDSLKRAVKLLGHTASHLNRIKLEKVENSGL